MNPASTVPTSPPAAPGALPVAGHLWQILRDPLLFFERRHTGPAARSGVVVVRVGPRPVHLVTRPDLVRHLLADPGTFEQGGIYIEGVRALAGNSVASCPAADHRVQRPILQPAFQQRRIADYSRVTEACADALARSWHNGQRLEMVHGMHRLAAEVVTRTLFSGPGTVQAGQDIQRLFPQLLVGLYRRMLLPVGWAHRMPLPANIGFRSALNGINRIIDREIRTYRSGGRDRGDLLSAMMHATDPRTGATLTDVELTEQVVGMLLAAVETTGSVAAWLLHCLAIHPKVEEAVLGELRIAVGDRPLRAGDLANLPLFKRVFAEVLRLYPPFWLLSRVTTGPAELGGHRIPGGADIAFSLYCLHRAPQAFPFPHRFDPDRWLPDRVTDAQREAHFPFGAGTRQCIGEVYGRTAIPLVVATLLRHWRLRHATGREVTPLVKGTMRPSPMSMTVTRRAAAYAP
ncbi:cytochrome P450 [Streptomyces lacrimifluminis]|uniref:Cytochrome P450 n=1 Tax=Streptomyces lacrimifluminis TaxID=1500077 RepID=A0A917NPB8_9ACTN|nr:cytochrome P450 [Streptomyces lacrimifluminis]GGJ16028.1 cytochrome P450 [Streptomyces lacrimifluminis]